MTDHEHRYVAVGPFRWFECVDCGQRTHASACVDEDGRLVCVCGLEERVSW